MLSLLHTLTTMQAKPLPPLVRSRKVFDSDGGKKVKSNKYTGISKLERRIRRLLEQHFGVEFSNVRLPCMKNPLTGRLLELDCYNETLKLAVEIQGHQHRSLDSHFYRNQKKSAEELYREQLQRDQIKLQLCEKNGIRLVQIHDNEITLDLLDSEVVQLILDRLI
jgi:hypothetical protein